MNTNELRFWKRFIDDGIGIWKGTRRTFTSFLTKLNKETNKYGINFPIDEAQFGKTFNFLNVTFYIDENDRIQYKSYTKPTDAKRYLRPQSFHPKMVFEAVPYSQMIRTLERNSAEETKRTEMEKLKKDFEKSGYSLNDLQKIEERTSTQSNEEPTQNEAEETITFPVFFFDGLNELKKIIYDAKAELRQLVGDTKIIMAVKKNPSIGNKFIRNKALSERRTQLLNQKCNAQNCRQCPLVNTSNTATVNNTSITTGKTLNCKSRNVIYLWQCQLCEEENSYFGRTIQRTHERTNTHRGCFTDEKWESSALSMHARSIHGENFNLDNFKISLIKQCSPQRIRREEFKYIDKFKTRTHGINRYKN